MGVSFEYIHIRQTGAKTGVKTGTVVLQIIPFADSSIGVSENRVAYILWFIFIAPMKKNIYFKCCDARLQLKLTDQFLEIGHQPFFEVISRIQNTVSNESCSKPSVILFNHGWFRIGFPVHDPQYKG